MERVKAITRSRISSGRRFCGAGCPTFLYRARATCRWQLRIRLLKSGVIDDVFIVDQRRFYVDKAFRNMALSARDAALLASPIQIPGVRYEKTQTLTIDLDPKAVLR